MVDNQVRGAGPRADLRGARWPVGFQIASVGGGKPLASALTLLLVVTALSNAVKHNTRGVEVRRIADVTVPTTVVPRESE
jgi:hypothetical protein